MEKIRQLYRHFTGHPHMERRIPLLLLSVTCMGLCVMVFHALGVGTDPFSVFCYAMAERMGLSLGTFEAIFNSVVFCLVLILDRKQIGLGSFANMFLVGYSNDFFTWLWGDLVPRHPDWGLRLVWFAPFAALFLLSVACYVVVELGPSPYDAMPIIIHNKLRQRFPRLSFKVVRIAFDTAFSLAGWILGGEIGLMTVVCCAGLGPAIEWMAGKIRRIVDPEAVKQGREG